MATVITAWVAGANNVDVHLKTIAQTSIRIPVASVVSPDRVTLPEPGVRLVDGSDLRHLDETEPRVTGASMIHELYEAALESLDPNMARHDGRHAAANAIENAVLAGTGLVRTDRSEPGKEMVDYGPDLTFWYRVDGNHNPITEIWADDRR